MTTTKTRKPNRRKQEYEETPDYASLFQRTENEPPRPQFTGDGILDAETLEAIQEDGGKFQISLWTLTKDGEPMRNRDGSRRFRAHIEPVWKEGNGADDAQAGGPADDDIPF